ncbi:MAG TPA: nuclear transport factor 2 family protein [Ohtaekwangia sp.]|nr:nuclear transport factor 2 family protein [Ohtaekwangia sp.]
MPRIEKVTFLFFLVSMSMISRAQDTNVQRIMDLEQKEVRAILTKDTLLLFNELWAPELIVNNPANIVVTKQQVVELLQTGKIDYETFDRTVEKISILGNTAIVMGREEMKPQGVTDNKGRHVVRRFTNIWLKRKGVWKLVARQATIASID